MRMWMDARLPNNKHCSRCNEADGWHRLDVINIIAKQTFSVFARNQAGIGCCLGFASKCPVVIYISLIIIIYYVGIILKWSLPKTKAIFLKWTRRYAIMDFIITNTSPVHGPMHHRTVLNSSKRFWYDETVFQLRYRRSPNADAQRFNSLISFGFGSFVTRAQSYIIAAKLTLTS